jgi:putative exporter of polyketide antibiotics
MKLPVLINDPYSSHSIYSYIRVYILFLVSCDNTQEQLRIFIHIWDNYSCKFDLQIS